jgi:hypothetical protein
MGEYGLESTCLGKDPFVISHQHNNKLSDPTNGGEFLTSRATRGISD